MFQLYYNNHADLATLSGGSWQLPLSNLQDPRPSKKARSTTASATQTKIRVDLGSAKEIVFVALTHTNLTSAAQYRITWYSDAFTTAVADTGMQDIKGYPDTDPDSIGAAIFHELDAAVTYRYFEIELSDAANPDGYVEAGRLFMPDQFEPENRFGTTNDDATEANTPAQNSLGGAGYFNRRTPKRMFSATMERLTETEIIEMRRVRKICNLNEQLVVVPDSADETNYNDRNFVARFVSLPSIKLMEGGEVAGTASIELTEVVG